MQHYKDWKVEDFVSDADFIQWVNFPDDHGNKYWKEVTNQFPEVIPFVNEAREIVQSLQAVESAIPDERIDELWKKINSPYTNKRSTLFPWMRWAAVLIILIGVAALMPKYFQTKEYSFAEIVIPARDAKIVLSDGSEKIIRHNESNIEVIASGKVVVNKDTLINEAGKKENESLVEVVMPYGKQTNLQLPDGTIVFLNSGSRIAFPAKFQGSNRDVHLSGEAYFKVVENKAMPFIVHTSGLDVTVTGTEFNVSAYNDDRFTQAVLVSGSVNVNKKGLFSKKIQIKPGESAYFEEGNGAISVASVNVDQHTAWIHGYVICKNDPLISVVRKLERYYNREIIVDSTLNSLSFSGKLDLKEDINLALKSVTYASAAHYEITDNNEIYIKN